MKTLIYGAGPIGSLYAYLLYKAGKDVTILARNKQFNFIKENDVVLVNEFTGEKVTAKVNVIDKLGEKDAYDLVVVAIRKNKILPVLQILSQNQNVKNILFMGNNTLGFDEYLNYLPKERILFGFPGAGGGRKEHVVHYIDSKKPNGKRLPIIIGEIDGEIKDRTRQIKSLFESANVPVNVVKDIDGWLKYHVAFVSPIGNAFFMCGNFSKLAKSKDSLRILIRACKEGGDVLKELGYTKRQPFRFNLFYWSPEWILIKVFQSFFSSKFVEIAFALHAEAAADEIKELANEFKTLIDKTSLKT
ncbi:MAG: ketopantoate reductase family protein, partial [candidate division Zixibacteria bacterium]|nr:ketopantoate reductase family protein [candidate division Zixibacteria bacterium]